MLGRACLPTQPHPGNPDLSKKSPTASLTIPVSQQDLSALKTASEESHPLSVKSGLFLAAHSSQVRPQALSWLPRAVHCDLPRTPAKDVIVKLPLHGAWAPLR